MYIILWRQMEERVITIWQPAGSKSLSSGYSVNDLSCSEIARKSVSMFADDSVGQRKAFEPNSTSKILRTLIPYDYITKIVRADLLVSSLMRTLPDLNMGF